MYFVDYLRRRRELWLGEGADSDSDHVGLPVRFPIDRRAATWAKMEGNLMAAVGRPCVTLCAPFWFNVFALEERSDTVSAACSLLAGEAVAKGNFGRLTFAADG